MLNPKAIDFLESRAIEAETAFDTRTYIAKRGTLGGRPDPKLLRVLLDYDPATGELTWRPRGNPTFDKKHAGNRAGSRNNVSGYWALPLGGRTLVAGPVIWAWMTGDWPPVGMQVDHKNVTPDDYRWGNLRLATPSQNTANRNKPVRNKSGFKGVSWDQRRSTWSAAICFEGKQMRIKGRFETAEAAYAAYCAEALRVHGDFARI